MLIKFLTLNADMSGRQETGLQPLLIINLVGFLAPYFSLRPLLGILFLCMDWSRAASLLLSADSWISASLTDWPKKLSKNGRYEQALIAGRCWQSWRSCWSSPSSSASLWNGDYLICTFQAPLLVFVHLTFTLQCCCSQTVVYSFWFTFK